MADYEWNNIYPRITDETTRQKAIDALTKMAKQCEVPSGADVSNLLMSLGVLAPNDDIQRLCEQAATEVALKNAMFDKGYVNFDDNEVQILVADVMKDLGVD